MRPRFAVSEFPNDNPELHDGLVWACPTPVGRALPTLRLRPVARARVLGPAWEEHPEAAQPAGPRLTAAQSEEPSPERLVVAAVAAPTTPAPVKVPPPATLEVVAEPAPREDATSEPAGGAGTASGFRAFVAALEAVLVERGASRNAANLTALFAASRLPREAFDVPTRTALVERGILDAKTARVTPDFAHLAAAWRDVLDGSSGDLGACGSTTLDGWGAELLAALLGGASRIDELKRALRQRGVAAFGMLAAA